LDLRIADGGTNVLLAKLPQADFQALKDQFFIEPMSQGARLFGGNDEVDQVYFPLSGMISLLTILKNGNSVETATVGREGVVGAMAGFGPYKSHVRAVVQLHGMVARIPAAPFRAVPSKPAILDLCARYNDVLLSQARINAACNLAHTLEARFCRWLLQTRDRAQSDILPFTQEFLAEMLGVRRTSITDVAVKMQAAGAITYSRGTIKVLALDKLRAISCECYDTLLEQTA
jgi:CRP-like cAMP-binding protein